MKKNRSYHNLIKMISVLFLSIMTISTFGAGTVYASIGDPSGPESIALDLYGESQHEAKPQPVAKTDNAVGALVQRYVEGDGTCVINEESRFYIVTSALPSDELLSTVRLVNAQFASEGIPVSTALPVVCGTAGGIRPGDIAVYQATEAEFDFDADTADVYQSYRMEISDRVEVVGCDPQGIYYGLVTLTELAMKNGVADNAVKIGACSITDGPDLRERTAFLDCGRKYFSPDWIENFIRRASFQRYNAIELHFTEDQGVRLDSEKFPWMTDGIKSLSREEMSEIIKFARTYHMKVIPSIDVPGHTRYMVEKYEEYVKSHPDWSFEYNGKTYSRSNTKGFGSIANHYSYNGETEKATYIGIDVTREHAVAFTDALIDDYAEFFASFGCHDFNIGGDELLGWYSFELGGRSFGYENRWEAIEHWDEYAKNTLGIENGSASDTFINYLNTVATRLEEKGYVCRVFNDEIDLNDDQHIELNSSIALNYWTGSVKKPGKYAEAGHVLYNDISKWCYYVVKEMRGDDIMNNDYKTVNAKNIYYNWDPRSYSSKKDKVRTVPDAKMGGAYFHIWCDHPDYKTDQDIWNETELRMWANSSKMWNPEMNSSKSGEGKLLTYGAFSKWAKGMDSFPGYNGKANSAITLAAPSELTDDRGLLEIISGLL